VIGNSDTDRVHDASSSKRLVEGARPFFIVAALLAAALVFWATWNSGPTPQPSLSEVSAEFSRIIPPPAAKPAAPEHEAKTKVGAVLVSSRYLITDSFESVRRYYRDELPKEGWRLRRAIASRGNWIDVYCKGPLQASVESISQDQSTDLFAFSISWSGVSLHECT